MIQNSFIAVAAQRFPVGTTNVPLHPLAGPISRNAALTTVLMPARGGEGAGGAHYIPFPWFLPFRTHVPPARERCGARRAVPGAVPVRGHPKSGRGRDAEKEGGRTGCRARTSCFGMLNVSSPWAKMWCFCFVSYRDVLCACGLKIKK